jgi:hypothetical protein
LLHEAGVTRVYGRPLGPLPHVAVADDDLAALLADAAGHIGAGPGVAHLSRGRLRVSSRPGGTSAPEVVRSQDDLARAVRCACDVASGAVPGTAVLQIELDLDAPFTGAVPPRAPMSGPAPVLPAPAPSVAVLAGPGVVRTGHLEAIRAFAGRARLGVANTWGAKGMFTWDSPHHLGTCGLQARDFELLGFGEVDLLVATGLDPSEAPAERWTLAPHVEVGPRHLGALAESWKDAAPAGPPNRLYPELAAVVQRLTPSTQVPLSPARAVADLRAALPANGMVAADPGLAGLWVARTFPTTDARSIGVPSTVASGYAAAAALSAALDGRPAIAVTDAPIDEPTARVLDLAMRLGAPLLLELWAGAGHLATAADHVDLLDSALAGGRATVLTVPVEATHTEALVAVAGEVIAWGGVVPSSGH